MLSKLQEMNSRELSELGTDEALAELTKRLNRIAEDTSKGIAEYWRSLRKE